MGHREDLSLEEEGKCAAAACRLESDRILRAIYQSQKNGLKPSIRRKRLPRKKEIQNEAKSDATYTTFDIEEEIIKHDIEQLSTN